MLSFFIVALFLVLHSGKIKASDVTNVGTVLFTKADVRSHAWSRDKLALLKARLYSQHLMPPSTPPKTSNFVNVLLRYFQNCYTTIANSATDLDTDRILTIAFTDVIGGYLKMVALPVVKYCYYYGTIPKTDALKLYLFYEDVKIYLGKNGSGWPGPDVSLFKRFTVDFMRSMAQVPLSPCRVSDPCRYLAFLEQTPAGFIIPTPVIDWASHTMHTPLANHSIVSLYSAKASDALHNYYEIASNCVRSKRPAKLNRFNERFLTWVQGEVMPHLEDESLYPALHGVLSLVNHTNNLLTYRSFDDPTQALLVKTDDQHHWMSCKTMIILIIVIAELICCIPSLVYILCRKKKVSNDRVTTSCIMIKSSNNMKSDSDSLHLDLYSSCVHIRKPTRGLKIQQRPAGKPMDVESSSVQSIETEKQMRHVSYCKDVVDKVSVIKQHRTSKDNQIKQSTRRVAPSFENSSRDTCKEHETSDGSTKTIMLSTHNPSKMTAITTTSHFKRSASGNISNCVKKTEVYMCSHQVASKTNEEFTTGKTTDVRDPAAPLQLEYTKEITSKEIVSASANVSSFNKIEVLKPAQQKNDSSESVEISTDNMPLNPFTGEKHLEMHIDRPLLEISVDVMQNRELKVAKVFKVSRIPKRATGSSKVTQCREVPRYRWTESKGNTETRRTMIPKLQWAVDDNTLKRKKSTKTLQLNITL